MTVRVESDAPTLSLTEALSALESARVENARLRRTLLDLLYNLDEENMPAVSARIKATEEKLKAESEGLSLLLSTDEEGGLHINGQALLAAIEALGASLSSLTVASEDGKEQIVALPDGIRVLRTLTIGSTGYERESTLSPASLTMKREEAGGIAGGDTLSLTPRGLCMPYVRRHFKSDKSGLYPLYIDADGNLVAVYA